jgi:hypothetical protein
VRASDQLLKTRESPGRSQRPGPLFRVVHANAGTIFASQNQEIFPTGAPMSDVIRFVPKAELERARLIREARAHYERVFPPADQAEERQDPGKR